MKKKKRKKQTDFYFLELSLQSVNLEIVNGMKNYSLTKLLSSPCGKYSDSEYLVMLGGHTVAYKYSNSNTYLNFWKLILIYYF